MDKDKLKRKYLADTLRMMAKKIENGFPLDEEQEKMLVKLSREIVILHPNEYNKPIPNGWERDENAIVDSRFYKRTTLPKYDAELKKQKTKISGREPGE